MGFSHAHQARVDADQAKRLNVPEKPAEQPQRGHGRGQITLHVEPQSRVPIIGLDSGCIPGTKPGSSAVELERAGRDIVRSRLHRNRFKPA